VATFEVRVRGIDLTVFELVAKVMGEATVEAIMAASQTVLAVAEGVALFYVVACLTTPVAHFVVVFAPGMYGAITNGGLSPASSFALEVGGLVHVAVDVTADAGNGVGGSKSLRALVHGQSFGLQGLFENSDAASELCGLGIVGAEVLDFPNECRIIFLT